MNSTFTDHTTAHSLRLHVLMEKQHRMEIGQRIRELRENSAETNRSIADAVGVGERSVAAWIAGGGIAYDNAKKVADLFGVDVDYIWRGRQTTETPDVLGALSAPGPDLSEINDKLDQIMAAMGLTGDFTPEDVLEIDPDFAGDPLTAEQEPPDSDSQSASGS